MPILFLLVIFSSSCSDDKNIVEEISGSYNVDEECSSAFFDYVISITGASGGSDRIVIANYGDFGVAVTATVNGNFIEIDDQTFNIDNQSVNIFNGLGEISGNTFTSNYAYSLDGGESELCTFSATKI